MSKKRHVSDPDYEAESNEFLSDRNEGASKKTKRKLPRTNKKIRLSSAGDIPHVNDPVRATSPSALAVLNLSESDSDDDELPKPIQTRVDYGSTSVYFPETSGSTTETTEYDFSNILASQEIIVSARQKFEKDAKDFMNLPSTSKGLEPSVSDLLAIGEKNVGFDDAFTMDSEEVDKTQFHKEKTIQITLENDLFKVKSNKLKKQTIFEKQLYLMQKENQLLMHKTHLLCLIAHGNYINTVINNCRLAQEFLYAEIPNYLKSTDHITSHYIKKLLNWFAQKYEIRMNTPASRIISSEYHLESFITFDYVDYSLKDLVMLFVSVLRSLGLKARFVMSFQPVPLKPNKTNPKDIPEKNTKTKLMGNASHNNPIITKLEDINKPGPSGVQNINKPGPSGVQNINKPGPSGVQNINKPGPSGVQNINKPGPSGVQNINKPGPSGVQNINKPGPSGVKNINKPGLSGVQNINKPGPLGVQNINKPGPSGVKNINKPGLSGVQNINKPGPSGVQKMQVNKSKTSKEKAKSKKSSVTDLKVLSEDSEAEYDMNSLKGGINYWLEVYIARERKWISVDVYSSEIDCCHQIYARCTKPAAYIIGWNNDNTLKEVTRRYVPMWHITSNTRVGNNWFEKSIRSFISRGKLDRAEEIQINDCEAQLNDPIPSKIYELKHHPLYALRRHLLKFECIYPPDAAPISYLKGEPVYSRYCVHEVHTREKWFREAKTVRVNEKPYKIVKTHSKSVLPGTEKIAELFGSWQVEDYIPPLVIDNKIPRNQYGNIEVYKPSMLPPGTVHLRVPGILRVAKKLNIDCAPALVGWEFRGGSSHPVKEGGVVCKEYEDLLMDAWSAEADASARRSCHKRRQKSFKKWYAFARQHIIKAQLKRKYNFGDVKKTNEPPPKEKRSS